MMTRQASLIQKLYARGWKLWSSGVGWRRIGCFFLGASLRILPIEMTRFLSLVFGIFFAVVILLILVDSQVGSANYDESKVGSYTLPDPLVFADGKPVRTPQDWRRRRAEILELFATNVFGHSPNPPATTTFDVSEESKAALGGKAIRKQVAIHLISQKDGPKESLLLYIPAAARKPVPVILTLNFMGNQSVISDPAVILPMIWSRNTHEQARATEDSRGRDQSFEIEKILARGYAFATIYYQDIDPDFKEGFAHGIRPLLLKQGQSPAPDDWGAIGAWSYGLSRAMDYLEHDKSVDAKRVAIMGHSRLGKTALWAGALDERFAMVISSCSGEGGASLARRNYGETVANLMDSFPYWFAENFRKYAAHVDQLPVDMHELIALSAPRPVYVTGAEDDQWADPKGEFLACVGAGPVYRLLGKQDLGTDQTPALNSPILHTIAFHIRSGKHEVTPFDWEQFLLFADKYLAGN
jgi:hypothetical protein